MGYVEFLGFLVLALFMCCCGAAGWIMAFEWRTIVHLRRQELGTESPQGWPLKPEDWLL